MALEDALTKEEPESLRAGLGQAQPVAAAADGGSARLYELGREPTVEPSLPALDRINRRFAQLLDARFDAMLWRNASARIAGARSALMLDAIEAVPANSLCARLGARGLRGEGLLVIGNTLAEAAVERMLGGPGRIVALRRIHTPVELRLLRRLADTVVAAYEAAWRPVNRMRFDVSALQTDPGLLDTFDPAQSAAAFDVRVSVGDIHVGDFSLFLPTLMLAPLRDILDGRIAATDAGDRRWRSAIAIVASDTKIELAAKFRRRMPLKGLLALQVGDVLAVDAPGDTLGEVNNITVQPGRSGSVNGRAAVEFDMVRGAPGARESR